MLAQKATVLVEQSHPLAIHVAQNHKQKEQSIVRYSVRRLENLGYNVTIIEPNAP